MNPLANFIEQQGFAVLDGALATELERYGADLDDPLWSARCLLEAPEFIRRVHLDYLEAGADVITSATYQASRQGFQQRGLTAGEAESLLRQGVEITVKARDDFWSDDKNHNGRLRPLVAASIGPFGACLHDGSEYHGNYAASWSEVAAFHGERMDVLSSAGADLLAFETIPSRREAEILLTLLSQFKGQFAWLSFSCRDQDRVSHGESFRECMELVRGCPQVVAAGLNCTKPQFVSALLRSVSDPACPLLVYPNSGESWVAESNCWVGQGSESFAPLDWYQAGARMIGGCCRTGPRETAQIRQVLENNISRNSS